MALVFQESFDVYGSGSTSRTNMLNSSNMWVDIPTSMGCTTTVSRTGTSCLYHTSGGSVVNWGAVGSLGKANVTADGYFGLGFAVRISTLPSNTKAFVGFMNTDGTILYSLYISPTGALVFSNGTTTFSSTSSGQISVNVFHHIEIKQKVQSSASATDGELYVRVNGTQVIGVTGTDFINSGSTANIETFNIFTAAPWGEFGNCYIDDLYVWDSTGAYCNDWIGNKACYTYFCDADTATAEWSINGTTQGFAAIDDTTPDADTTYLAAASVGLTSIFEFPTINSSLSGIKAVTVQSAIRQDSSGVSEVQVAIGNSAYTNGTSRVAPFPGATSSVYTVYQDHFYQDPDGAGDFDPTIVSALKLKLMRTV